MVGRLIGFEVTFLQFWRGCSVTDIIALTLQVLKEQQKTQKTKPAKIPQQKGPAGTGGRVGGKR